MYGNISLAHQYVDTIGVILYTVVDLQENETGIYCCILDVVADNDTDEACIEIELISG